MVTQTVLAPLGGDAGTAGYVKVSPPSVAAEGMVDLEVKYTATKHLAERKSGATTAEDGMSTYGRIQITLPPGWGPDVMVATPPPGMIYEKPQSDPKATSLDLDPSGGVTVRPGKDPDPDC